MIYQDPSMEELGSGPRESNSGAQTANLNAIPPLLPLLRHCYRRSGEGKTEEINSPTVLTSGLLFNAITRQQFRI